MHSLETGVIVSIAVLFFYSFLSFVFLRETNISREILSKYSDEKKAYDKSEEINYNPELLNNIIDILREEGIIKDGDEK